MSNHNSSTFDEGVYFSLHLMSGGNTPTLRFVIQFIFVSLLTVLPLASVSNNNLYTDTENAMLCDQSCTLVY